MNEELEPVGVTRAQAARMLNVHVDTIDKLVKQGLLDVFTLSTNKKSGRVRITVASIKALPEANQVQPTERQARNPQLAK